MKYVTSATLIERLKDKDDEESWNRFYEIYSPLILAFSRSKGCNQELAHDILQEAMVILLSTMPKFDYSPKKGRFRNFLLTIVMGRIRDTYKREKWYCSLASETKSDWVMGIEDTRLEIPGKKWDQLWKHNLFHHALENVKTKINKLTYQSFALYVLADKSTEYVAKQLNIEKNAVFQHKNRVMKLLREEIKTLKRELGEE